MHPDGSEISLVWANCMWDFPLRFSDDTWMLHQFSLILISISQIFKLKPNITFFLSAKVNTGQFNPWPGWAHASSRPHRPPVHLAAAVALSERCRSGRRTRTRARTRWRRAPSPTSSSTIASTAPPTSSSPKSHIQQRNTRSPKIQETQREGAGGVGGTDLASGGGRGKLTYVLDRDGGGASGGGDAEMEARF
jgi:hypothetical protein